MRTNQVVTFGVSMVFDCSVAQSFEVALTGNSSPSIATPVAGELYALSFTQDATGGRVVTAPLNAVGTGPSGSFPLDPDPNTKTTLLFVCRADLKLYPATPGTYN
jgi:hypothetical protein